MSATSEQSGWKIIKSLPDNFHYTGGEVRWERSGLEVDWDELERLGYIEKTYACPTCGK